MRLEKKQIVLESLDEQVDPAVLAVSDMIEVDLQDVFEMLCIDDMCCRAKIACQVEFKDIY